MSTEVLSLVAAGAGAICLVLWPLFTSRRIMLLVQLGVPVGFSVHYGLVGAETGALLNALGALQVVSALLFGTDPRLRWIARAMIPAILAACVVTWAGLPSLLSTIGTAFISVGRVQQKAEAMRWLVVAGTPFWLVHDILVGSPLVMADLLALVLGTLAIIRAQNRQRTQPMPAESPPTAGPPLMERAGVDEFRSPNTAHALDHSPR